MFKKLIFINIFLFIFLTGFVIAQSSANAAAMEQEIAQVQQDLQDGKITQGQATQRMMEIQQKFLMGTPTTPATTQPQNLQGQHAGWPASQAFQSFQFPVLNQPTGTNASFNYTPVSALEIFIEGGNTTTVMQDLAKQVNYGTNNEMSVNSGTYTLNIERSGVVRGNLKVVIEQKNGIVVFSLSVN